MCIRDRCNLVAALAALSIATLPTVLLARTLALVPATWTSLLVPAFTVGTCAFWLALARLACAFFGVID